MSKLVKEKKELLERIGARIIEIRTQKNLSQSDLARMTGKDRQSIHRVETGQNNVTVFYLLEVAHALGVDVSEFMQKKG